jgi:hypothetical protein
MITCLSDWDWDNDIDSPYTNIPQSVKDIGQHVRDAFNAVVPAENLALRYVSTPAKDTTNITVNDAFTQIITGKDDIEAMFNKFVQESLDKGMSKAIEELNAKATELGLK